LETVIKFKDTPAFHACASANYKPLEMIVKKGAKNIVKFVAVTAQFLFPRMSKASRVTI